MKPPRYPLAICSPCSEADRSWASHRGAELSAVTAGVEVVASAAPVPVAPRAAAAAAIIINLRVRRNMTVSFIYTGLLHSGKSWVSV
jgi:hypothetical protein